MKRNIINTIWTTVSLICLAISLSLPFLVLNHYQDTGHVATTGQQVCLLMISAMGIFASYGYFLLCTDHKKRKPSRRAYARKPYYRSSMKFENGELVESTDNEVIPYEELDQFLEQFPNN